MIMLGSGIAIVSAAVGVWAGVTWRDTINQLVRDTHKSEMDEIYEEVKRLRTQIANLIGRE